jgi:hypothetical protein
MRLQIFKTAILTLAAITAVVSRGIAQQIQANTDSDRVTAYYVPAVPLQTYTTYDSFGATALWSQDSTYRKKMEKLRAQMRDLQKEMSQLSREEMKKNATAMQENGRKLALRYKDLSSKFDQKFNSDFNRNFNFKFNFDTESKDFKEKIASGEIKEKTKSYSKSYSVDGNDVLKIDNSYGKVTINTWNKNEFKVDVQIKAYANDEGDAQKLLESVSIKDNKEASTVAFKTNIEKDEHNTSWGTTFTKGKTYVRKVEVNYVVYMPTKNPLTITNKFGSTQLPNFNGKLLINNSYGGLLAKTLTNPANQISVKFGAANIESLIASDINVSYGSLVLGNADKLNADVSFSSTKIGKITTSGNINVKYGGGLQIADIDKSVKNLSVNSSFSSVKLGVGATQNANFDITVTNGNFSYGDNPVVLISNPDHSNGYQRTKTFKGKLGKGDTDKVITVKSTYGTVKFD